MNIGLFTDTYFPQVSGVATSIKTLKDELERRGNRVYIFTTTDPKADKETDAEQHIYRFSSIPFVSFTERRIAVRGLFQAYQIAKDLKLDIIHTQTEFSLGMIGKFVAKNLNIPVMHTYHTMYEDYLHYIANGKLVKPYHVREAMLAYCHHLDGIIAPSTRVLDSLTDYGVKSPIRIIPTGIDINHYASSSKDEIREKLNLSEETPVMVSIGRVAYEKNISETIDALPDILEQVPDAMLVIVGEGPAGDDLQAQVDEMELGNHVIFTGEINNDNVNDYYRMADVFVSTSNSESQGLTYIEAVAADTKVVVAKGPYTNWLVDDRSIGATFSDKAGFVAETVDYLKNRNKYPDKPVLRKQRLHDISAEYFGEQVVDYYHDVIRAYEPTKTHEESIAED